MARRQTPQLEQMMERKSRYVRHREIQRKQERLDAAERVRIRMAEREHNAKLHRENAAIWDKKMEKYKTNTPPFMRPKLRMKKKLPGQHDIRTA